MVTKLKFLKDKPMKFSNIWIQISILYEVCVMRLARRKAEFLG